VEVQRATQTVSALIYFALLVATVRFWERQRERVVVWLIATFGLLALLAILGWALPDEDLPLAGLALWDPLRLAVDAIVLALLAFPYLLHRFARSFHGRVSISGRVADVGTATLAVWAVLLPSYPDPGQPQPAWFVAFVISFLAWWFLLLLGVAVSMWRAGRGHPGVARRRMRLMAGAAVLMNGAVLGSTMTQDNSGRPTTAGILISSVLGWLSAVSFLVGFTPPTPLRRLWRAEEEARLRQSDEGLMLATTRAEAAQLIVGPAAALLGGRAATIFGADGAILARIGEVPAVEAADDDGPTTTVVVGQQCRLVVERTPYTPLFGTDEEALLRSLGGRLDMALERLAAFEASEAARREAQRVTVELQQLVYGISHDLRNPLHTITGFLELLTLEETDRLSEDGRGFLERIHASTTYMERLINDLLELSRVGRADSEPTDVDMRRLVLEIGRDIETRYRGVTVQCDAETVLRINAVRARQLFTNLIENAARHGGRERLTIWIGSRSRGNGFAEVLVADDGVGVPAPYREKVFGIFERLEGFSSSATGTGVGLTMCRRIVEDLSGSIEIVDSETGTHVRMVLPEMAGAPRRMVFQDA
jgi:signal transduction histidine kinase